MYTGNLKIIVMIRYHEKTEGLLLNCLKEGAAGTLSENISGISYDKGQWDKVWPFPGLQ